MLHDSSLVRRLLFLTTDSEDDSYYALGVEHGEKVAFGQANLPGMRWFGYSGQVPGAVHLDPLLRNSDLVDPSHRAQCGPESDLLYIYTR